MELNKEGKGVQESLFKWKAVCFEAFYQLLTSSGNSAENSPLRRTWTFVTTVYTVCINAAASLCDMLIFSSVAAAEWPWCSMLLRINHLKMQMAKSCLPKEEHWPQLWYTRLL